MICHKTKPNQDESLIKCCYFYTRPSGYIQFLMSQNSHPSKYWLDTLILNFCGLIWFNFGCIAYQLLVNVWLQSWPFIFSTLHCNQTFLIKISSFVLYNFLFTHSNMVISCLNFSDEAWWFLSLRVFGLLPSSLLLFPQCFGWYVLLPSLGVCRTWEPTWNFELHPLLNPRRSSVLIPFAITGCKC